MTAKRTFEGRATPSAPAAAGAGAGPHAAAALLLLVVAPFLRGLWFEGERLGTAVLLLIAAGLSLWRERRRFDPDGPLLAFLTLAVLYAAAAFWAVSRHDAVMAALSAASVPACYLLLKRGAAERRFRRWMIWAPAAAGGVLSLVSVALAAGSLDLPGGIYDGRVGGPFQYPNALAAFSVAAAFLAAAARLRAETARGRALAGALLAASAFTLPLTGSRGAVLGLLAGVAVFSFCRGVPPRWAASALLLPELAGFACGLAWTTRVGGGGWSCWAAFVAVLTVGAAGDRWLTRVAGIDLPLVAALIVLAASSPVLFPGRDPVARADAESASAIAAPGAPGAPGRPPDGPGSLLSLVPTFDRPVYSAQFRLRYAKDAWRLIRERPWLGGGGGAWNVLYRTQQSSGYTSRYVHNHYLETWLEVGIGGLAAWLALWVWLLRTARHLRSGGEASPVRSAALGAATGLLTQAAVDFTLTFPALLYLVAALLALAGPVVGNGATREPASRQTAAPAAAAALALLFLGLSAAGASFWTGAHLAAAGDRRMETADWAGARRLYALAGALEPWNAWYRAREGLLDQILHLPADRIAPAAEQKLGIARDLEPYNPYYPALAGRYYGMFGKHAEAVAALERAVTLDRFSLLTYELLADEAIAGAEAALGSGDSSGVAALAAKAVTAAERARTLGLDGSWRLELRRGQGLLILGRSREAYDVLAAVKVRDVRNTTPELLRERIAWTCLAAGRAGALPSGWSGPFRTCVQDRDILAMLRRLGGLSRSLSLPAER